MARRVRMSVLIAAAAMMMVALSAGAVKEAVYIDAGSWNVLVPPPVPPTGTPWDQLYPDTGHIYLQTGYHDNGDGIVSTCDNLELDGVMHHVDWVGPTYWIALVTDTMVVEPDPSNPDSLDLQVCDYLHEISPDFCTIWHVEDFIDNDLSGSPSVGDEIVITTQNWVIVDVTLDVIATVEVPAVDRFGLAALIAVLLVVTALMLVHHRRRKAGAVA